MGYSINRSQTNNTKFKNQIKMAPIIAHYKSNNFPTAFEPLEVETGNMDEAPMSRTHQYRKVMKPLLERKRRARINQSLDELKDLMVFALQSEGESITKLEKADVLELTVRHLQKLKRQKQLQIQPGLDTDRYRAGYSACVNEVSRFFTAVPGVSMAFGNSLVNHLGHQVNAPQNTCHSRPTSSISPLSVGTVSPKPVNNKCLETILKPKALTQPA